MSTSHISNSLKTIPSEVVDKIFGFLDYGSLFCSISLVCSEWRAKPLIQKIICTYNDERKACLNEGYPLDLINSLLKHSISIWRLPVLKGIQYDISASSELIDLGDLVHSTTQEPTSLLKFRSPTGELGLVMRIKCLAAIKFKDLESIIPPDLDPLIYNHHMWPVKSYQEEDVFKKRILFLTIIPWTKEEYIFTNHWSSDRHAFMNYAYVLKGIHKELTRETPLNQFMEEMLVGDELFQIYSSPDQIDPAPTIPAELLKTPAKVEVKRV